MKQKNDFPAIDWKINVASVKCSMARVKCKYYKTLVGLKSYNGHVVVVVFYL